MADKPGCSTGPSEKTCPICTDELKQPRTLECAHVFCKPCLQSYLEKGDNVNNEGFNCPICRHFVKAPNARQFPASFLADYEKPVQLFLKTIVGKTRTINGLKLSDTVRTLRLKVQELEKIPPDQQRLLYDGKELQDQETLEKYGIHNESTIHLLARLRGG